MEWPWKFPSCNAQEVWQLSNGPKEHAEPKKIDLVSISWSGLPSFD